MEIENIILFHKKKDEEVYNYLLKNVKSAWRSHFWLLTPLIRIMRPEIILELGTDRGFSLLTFLAGTKGEYGKIYGIDSYGSILENDPGFKNGLKRYRILLDTKQKFIDTFGIKLDTTEIKVNLFSKARSFFDNKKIDILHIDGRHEYECVKEDYELYKDLVDLNEGLIVFHDVLRKTNDFGVYKLFNSIESKKFWLYHHSGLGIVTNSDKVINYLKEIVRLTNNCQFLVRDKNGKSIKKSLDTSYRIEILNEGNIPEDILY